MDWSFLDQILEHELVKTQSVFFKRGWKIIGIERKFIDKNARSVSTALRVDVFLRFGLTFFCCIRRWYLLFPHLQQCKWLLLCC